MLTVQCPKCKHLQKTDPKNVQKAVKVGVYCGHGFKLLSEGENRIVKRE